jgi:hypothetical protein
MNICIGCKQSVYRRYHGGFCSQCCYKKGLRCYKSKDYKAMKRKYKEKIEAKIWNHRVSIFGDYADELV